MIRMVGILTLSALFCCASADVLRLDPNARPPVTPGSVAVLLDEPEKPYEVIGLIEVSDEGWGLSMTTLAKKMRQEAAKLGGQAVIIGRQTNDSGAVIVPIGSTWMAMSLKEEKMVGKVIVYKTQNP